MQLYTLLIVEDEDILLEGLCNMFDWKNLGFSVTAQASNGKEALTIFRRKPVDVVLTDIRMPELNGVELLKAVKESNPETEVIFISSYAEFEYAQKAVEYKAFSYVMKTELFDELENVFSKLHSHLERIKQERRINISNRQFASIRILFDGLRTGNWSALTLPGPYYQIMALPSEENDNVLNLPADIPNTLWGRRGKNILFLLSGQDTESLGRLVLHLTQQILSHGRRLIAVSRYKRSKSDIRTAFYEALKLSDITPAQSGLASYEEIAAELPVYRAQESWRADHLAILLTNGLLKDFLDEAKAYIDCCAQSCDIFVYNCSAHFLSVFSRAGDIYGGKIQELYNILPSRFNSCEHFHELYAAVSEAARNVTEALGAQGHNMEEEMQRILNFVQSSFQSNIRLQDIAAHFYLSVPYLSTLFKKYTGMTFTSYLREYRLQWAAHLLETTTLHVQKIAQDVGYTDQKYFVQLFFHKYGTTPAAYRAGRQNL